MCVRVSARERENEIELARVKPDYAIQLRSKSISQNFNGNELSSPFCTLYFIRSLCVSVCVWVYATVWQRLVKHLFNVLCR